MLVSARTTKVFALMAVAEGLLLSALLVAPALAGSRSFTFTPTKGGAYLNYSYRSTFPATVIFTLNGTSPGSTDFWEFGDGTNATGVSVTHTYTDPCLYTVTEVTTAVNGSTTKGAIDLGLFASGPTSQAMAVCPPDGTAGLMPVEIAGGFFTTGQQVQLLMNGTEVGNVTANSGGEWSFNVTSLLPPEPNGTKYEFTTSPQTGSTTFTTLEGIEASPRSGVPGDTVMVEGRSYPSDSNVSVGLANVTLGPETTSLNGSFTGAFSVPSAAPLGTPGTYSYVTGPPILGAHAVFVSGGSTTTPVLGSSLSWLWLLLVLAALVAIACWLAWVVGKRRRGPGGRSSAEPRIHR